MTGLGLRTLLAASALSPRLLSVQPALLESSLAWIMSLQETDGSFQVLAGSSQGCAVCSQLERRL